MIIPEYYSILGVGPDSSPEEVRRAYHTLAKENHPDLFPEEERPVQHLRMMKINEAYIGLASAREQFREQGADVDTAPVPPGESDEPSFRVGSPTDQANVYYRQGFDYYMTGQRVFHKRFSIQEPDRIRNILNYRKGILNLAVTALQNFSRSYSCFLQVVNEFPDSMWADDAREKLGTLEKFNQVYQKICENLGGND